MGRDFSVLGHALSAPARSVFLNLLMDGSTRPAGELAAAARVGPSTASEHLAVLVAAGLLTCEPRGRQRFYALAGAGVAAALEQLGHLCPPLPATGYRQSRAARDLAEARLCYDHLAGRLGVALARALVAHRWIDPDLTAPTPGGTAHFAAHGIDVPLLAKARRPLARPCPDWTERHPHLAGALGAALADTALARGWAVRRSTGRGLRLTAGGRAALVADWGTDLPREPPASGAVR